MKQYEMKNFNVIQLALKTCSSSLLVTLYTGIATTIEDSFAEKLEAKKTGKLEVCAIFMPLEVFTFWTSYQSFSSLSTMYESTWDIELKRRKWHYVFNLNLNNIPAFLTPNYFKLEYNLPFMNNAREYFRIYVWRMEV